MTGDEGAADGGPPGPEPERAEVRGFTDAQRAEYAAALVRRADRLVELSAELKERRRVLDELDEKLDERRRLLDEMEEQHVRRGELFREAGGRLSQIASTLGETARRLLRLDDRLGEIENRYPELMGDLPSARIEVMAEGRRLVDQAEQLENMARFIAPEPETRIEEPAAKPGTAAPAAKETGQKTARSKSPPLIPYDDSLSLRLTGLFCLTMGGGGLIGLAAWLIPMPAALVHFAEPFGRQLMAIGLGVVIVHDMLRRRAKRSRE